MLLTLQRGLGHWVYVEEFEMIILVYPGGPSIIPRVLIRGGQAGRGSEGAGFGEKRSCELRNAGSL